MGRGGEILELLAGENVDGDQVDLGMTVLSSLGGRHVNDLARAALDDDVTVLAQSRALHREGQRRAGVGRLEGVLMLERGKIHISKTKLKNRCNFGIREMLMAVACHGVENSGRPLCGCVGRVWHISRCGVGICAGPHEQQASRG